MKEKISAIKNNIIEFINKKKLYCVIGVFCILLVITVLILIPEKNENSFGNLINEGFAVRSGKWTYYTKLNGYEDDGIYKTNAKGTKIEKISDSTGLYLNTDGKFLYYVEYNEENNRYDLVKMKINGKQKTILVENVDNEMITISDGRAYYVQDNAFYQIKTNGRDRIKISNENIISFQIVGKNVYYSYREGVEISLAKMDNDGKSNIVLAENCSSNFYVQGNKIFFIKEEYNKEKYEYQYTLCSMKTNGEKVKQIAELSNNIKQINMAKDAIYYVATEDYEVYELCKMDYEGNNNVKITEIKIGSKINVIENDIFYLDLNDDNNFVNYKIDAKGTNKIKL